MARTLPPFLWQPRDLEILKAIFEHRFLTRGLILPIFEVVASIEDTNLDRRLRKLVAAGYLRRLQRDNRRAEYVYALSGAGAEILKQRRVRLPFADWAEKNRAVKPLFIEHTLMVSRWYVALVVALREISALTLGYYERESRPRGQYALLRKWQGRSGTLRRVNPDAFLVLDGVHPSAHFLEADQSTMAHGRMAEKFEDYAAMYREKRHPELFGVDSFRVCVVTKTEARASNLIQLLVDGTGVEPDERRLFWFASEESYREAPSNILACIWRRADDPLVRRSLVGSPLPLRSPAAPNPQGVSRNDAVH